MDDDDLSARSVGILASGRLVVTARKASVYRGRWQLGGAATRTPLGTLRVRLTGPSRGADDRAQQELRERKLVRNRYERPPHDEGHLAVAFALSRPVCRALASPTPWSASIAGAGFEPATFGL